MRKQLLIVTSLLSSLSPANANENATPDEVVGRVREAAALIGKSGEEAIRTIADRPGTFVWKDSYVFVVNCAADRVIANSQFPTRIGGDIKQHTDYEGIRYGLALCKAAAKPNGGWVDYCWPRPGTDEPRIKSSFVLAVAETSYQVGAGLYRNEKCADSVIRRKD